MDNFFDYFPASPFDPSPLPSAAALRALRDRLGRHGSTQAISSLPPDALHGLAPQSLLGALAAPTSPYSSLGTPASSNANASRYAPPLEPFMQADAAGYRGGANLHAHSRNDPLSAQRERGAGNYLERSAAVAAAQQVPLLDPASSLTTIAERNPACTNASWTCLQNLPYPENRTCELAERACNLTIETLRNAPRPLNVPTVIRFPDGTTVVLEGGPGGAVYIIPSPRPRTSRPGPMR